MTDNSVKSFGRYLKSVRQKKGIALDEIAAATRISEETLSAIEDEAHDRLPAAVFVKGFIRAYAKNVGADGDLAVQGFETSLAACQATAQHQSERARSQQVFWPRLALGLIMLAAIAFGSVYVLSIGTRGSHEPSVESLKDTSGAAPQTPPPAHSADQRIAPLPEPPPAEKSDTVIEPTPSAEAPSLPVETSSPTLEMNLPEPPSSPAAAAASSAEKPPGETPPPSVPVDMKQRLRIDTVEETWIKVIMDGIRTREYMLKPGDHLQLEAEKGFNLLIGNAAGIAVSLNGRTISIDGKSGQVVTLQVP